MTLFVTISLAYSLSGTSRTSWQARITRKERAQGKPVKILHLFSHVSVALACLSFYFIQVNPIFSACYVNGILFAKAALKGGEIAVLRYSHWQFHHRPHYHAPVSVALQLLLHLGHWNSMFFLSGVLEEVTTL